MNGAVGHVVNGGRIDGIFPCVWQSKVRFIRPFLDDIMIEKW
jgi:hypothetical protein